MKLETYLFFNGRAEEAIEFYRRALGAEVLMMMRMKDSPEPQPPGLPPGSENKVMHASLKIGESNLMLSDGMAAGGPDFRGFDLSISAKDEAEAKRIFNAVGEGGTVRMPLGKTFFAPCFGITTDRFGVGWMVLVPGQ